MPENLTPRQMVKGMLRGNPPPRPLFLPIVFSLGARVENLPLRVFLGNATKVSNSLRQIRAHLHSDGVACYFDPYLEAEALGGELRWEGEDQQPSIHWPSSPARGVLPEGLRSPEEAARSGRVAVALEVIRRLKSLLRDDPLLMAGVAGPFTLAARLTGLECEDRLQLEDLPDAALELAASAIQQISAALVEAGANVVFIQESILPALSAESCETWASLLGPTVNIIRFYEALPVLQLTSSRSFAENSAVILQRSWDCIVCPALEGFSTESLSVIPSSSGTSLGVALPFEAFSLDDSGSEELDRFIHQVISGLRPAIVTTPGDVPSTIDMKRLIKVGENVRG